MDERSWGDKMKILLVSDASHASHAFLQGGLTKQTRKRKGDSTRERFDVAAVRQGVVDEMSVEGEGGESEEGDGSDEKWYRGEIGLEGWLDRRRRREGDLCVEQQRQFGTER